MKSNKSAVGYIRVSTAHQAENGVSLDNQKQRIRDYCQYNDLNLLEILEDAGISGSIGNGRNGFAALFDKVEDKTFDVLILFSIERLSRDMVGLFLFEQFLADNDTELHTIQGQLNTSDSNGFMIFGINALMSEIERRQISQRTASAMGFKKSQGFIVGTLPYGYKRDGDSNKLIEYENEQVIINLANDLYSKGYRLKDIVEELNNRGFQNRVGKKWVPVRVSAIIKNYKGSFTKSKKKSGQLARDYFGVKRA